MCKAIGQETQAQIEVQVMPNGTVRFVVIGRRTKSADDSIHREFCIVSV